MVTIQWGLDAADDPQAVKSAVIRHIESTGGDAFKFKVAALDIIRETNSKRDAHAKVSALAAKHGFEVSTSDAMAGMATALSGLDSLMARGLRGNIVNPALEVALAFDAKPCEVCGDRAITEVEGLTLCSGCEREFAA